MKKIAIIALPILLSGCAIDSLSTLTGSTYESFEGKFVDKHLQETNDPNKDTLKNDEFKNVINARAAADKSLITNPYIEKYLQEIVTTLLDNWESDISEPIYVKISADRNYSASATKNTIVITQGVLSDAESEDEIAYILAHELSHILLGHNQTNEYFAKQSALVSKAANVAMTAAVVKDIDVTKGGDNITLSSKQSESSQKLFADSFRTGLTINRLSRDVISSSMTRKSEDEADLLGMDLLVKAGYSPRAFIPVIERLDSSQTFTKQQLAEKKQEFQNFVSLASDAGKHVSGGDWTSIAYLAANEGATHLLQQFAERHGSPIERKKDIASYVKREYRKERRRPLTTEEFNTIVKQGKGNQIQQNYWFASEAILAIEFGDLETAEKLARKSVSGVTKDHAYPRLAFYTVRKLQNKPEKAAQNLALIKNWDYASIQTFSIAAQSLNEMKNTDKAVEVLNKGEEVIGTRVPFLPEYVSIYKGLNDDKLMTQYLEECGKVSEENITAQCYAKAGVPLEQAKGSSILGTLDSLTNIVEF